MDGTQIPIKVASCLDPWKYNNSEKTKERSAATKSSLSAKVNFLNILQIDL